MNKFLKFSAAVLLIGVLIGVYQPSVFHSSYVKNVISYCEKVPYLDSALKYYIKTFHSRPQQQAQAAQQTQQEDSKDEPIEERLFTKEELAKYKGENGSPIYLALMGKVYDVSRGKDFYGPGGGYSFFTGLDGTRAFVSGEFTPTGLIDDISGLEEGDYLGINEWVNFYAKDYPYVGKVQGSFYDAEGNPTEYLATALKWLAAAVYSKEEDDLFKEKYPMCNIDYKPDEGTTVWCSKSSGGVNRDWVGLPRSLYSATDSKIVRCACVQEKDLSDPLLKEYPDCANDSITCKLAVNK
nr:EOG090X0A5G [Polyphemus pediculus]